MSTKIINNFILILLFLTIFVSCSNKPDSIFTAIEHNNIKKIKSIVEEYPDVLTLQYSEEDRFAFDYPLYISTEIETYNLEIIELLFNESLKKELYAEIYITFRDSLLSKKFDICDVFINNGYDLNSEDIINPYIYPAMFWEIPRMYDNLEGVIYLAENGIDFNKSLDDKDFPLYKACDYGNIDVVKVMIENGADVNARDKDGATALFDAVEDDKKDILKLLLLSGADPNITVYGTGTPVNVFIKSKASLQLLLGYNLNINLHTNNNYGILKPILFDIDGLDENSDLYKSKIELLEYAIEMGADINLRYKGVESPLKYALDNDLNEEIINILVTNGAVY